MWQTQTVEAEIEVGGQVRLLEDVAITRKSRALVTIFEEKAVMSSQGSAVDLLAFLRANRLPEAARPGLAAIEAQIAEAREAWD